MIGSVILTEKYFITNSAFEAHGSKFSHHDNDKGIPQRVNDEVTNFGTQFGRTTSCSLQERSCREKTSHE